MQRVKNTARNTVFASLKFATNIVMQFVLRTVFIWVLGLQYLGIDSLFINVIQILNVVELGIGVAISQSMYKPAAERDIEKLKSLNILYKRLYMIIAVVILVFGVAIIPVIPHLISSKPTVNINIYIVYAVFLLDTIISYFAAHKRTLLFVHQRNDIQSKVSILKIFLLRLLQITGLLLFANYYIYLALIPVGTLFECLIILIAANKLYPEINGKAQKLDAPTRKVITKNIAALSLHRLGGVVVLATDNILISIFFGLTILGTSANYIIIDTSVVAIIGLFITSVHGSIGNMIASSDSESNYKTYKSLNFGFSMLVGFCAICMLCLYQPFIESWLGADYLLSFIVAASIVAKFYIMHMRSITSSYKECAGLAWNDRFRPIAEVILNIGLSVLFIKLFGLSGVFWGTVASTLLSSFWIVPYILFKNYFKKSVWEYFARYLIYTSATAIAGLISYYLCSLLPHGIVFLALRLTICIFVTVTTYLICFTKTKEFKDLYTTITNFLKKSKTPSNNPS